jgi:DNA-binding NarL/FixJ family response regulator
MVRILIADDYGIVRYGLRRILERQPDWEVVAEARDGKTAVSKAIDTKPDVAILDYSMPLINGIEATRQLRLHLPNTEVLILTVHADDDLIYKCLKAGARSYLLKSDMQVQLLSAVQSLAVHRPFFSGAVSEILLESFLGIPARDMALTAPAIRNSAAVAADELEIEERSVLQLAAEGHTSEEIANRFNLNLKLVEALIGYAVCNGLVER